MRLLVSGLLPAVFVVGCSFLPGRGTAPPHSHEGFVHMQNGEYDAADKAYAQVGEHDPQYVHALVQRGLIAAVKGDVPRGLALMKQAEAVNPTELNKRENFNYHAVYARYLTQGRIEVSELPFRLLSADGILVAVSSPQVNVDHHHTVTAYDEATLQAAWSQVVVDAPEVAIAGGALVAVVETDHKQAVVAFALDSGSERWRVPMARPSRLGGDDHTVYITEAGTFPETPRGGTSWRMRALDATTGRPRWTLPIADQPGRLAVGGERVVFRSDDGVVHALRARDGTTLWELGLPARVDPDRPDRPVVGADTVVITTTDGAVIALDASDKPFERPMDRMRWQLPAEEYTRNQYAVPAILGDQVIVPSKGGMIAVDLATGKERWKQDIPLPERRQFRLASATAARGDVIVGKVDEAVVALDASGNLRWIFQDATFPSGGRGKFVSWQVGRAEPVVTDAGIWIAVESRDETRCIGCGVGTFTILRLAPAPEVAY